MTTKPNILVIMTDHANAASLREGSQCIAPNLAALSQDGVQFEQCYTTNAICSPARASLMTGLYPSTHGIWDVTHAHNSDWIDAPAGRFKHFAELLSEQGYRNGYFGKWHVEQSNHLENFGWHEFDVTTLPLRIPFSPRINKSGRDTNYPSGLDFADEVIITTDGYPDYLLSATVTGTNAITHPVFDKGMDFIERHIANNGLDVPFTCFISVLEPHDPYLAPEEAMVQYDPQQITLSPSFDDDLTTKPEVLRRMRSVWSDLSKSDWKKIVTSYYASLTSVDTEIGRVINLLKEKNLYENTVIVFTSDHGDCLTDHGHSQKWTMYDQVVRVPMLVWSPTRFKGGHTVNGLIQSMDVGVSLLEFAGASVPNTVEAISVAPALHGNEWQGRDYVYAEQMTDGNYTEGPFMTMVRDRDWKLVHFLDEEYGQLFDLRSDPNEANNLWDEGELVVNF